MTAKRPPRRRRSGRPPKRTAPRQAPTKAALSVALEEDALCERVVVHLHDIAAPKPPPPTRDDQAMVTLRDQIAGARLEDVPALVAQMEQVSAVASRRGRQTAEPVDPASPYFGHLRLDEKGRGERDVLIGKTTFIEPRAEIRIVDWRHAPVSRLYYRHAEGAHYEETFGDREVEGQILTRRTVTIAAGKLQRIAYPQGVVVRSGEGWQHLAPRSSELSGGEGTALRAEHLRGVLGVGGAIEQREDRHLPEIAALLDAKQFELIAHPDSGLVVVQGGAGSGKTTIGVHRLAFLAYQARARFTPDRMLVVVGTPALKSYIAHLLAALRLAEVRVVTFDGWARRARERLLPWLHAPVEDNTPAEVTRLKADPRLLPLFAARADTMRAEGRMRPRDALWLWADVLTDRQALGRALAGPRSGATAPAASATADRRTLDNNELERAWHWCADRCPAVVEWQPSDDRAAAEPVEGADGTIEPDDERATLDREDDALLLRCYQLLGGTLRSRRNRPFCYEHLFVDEAQDLAAVHLAALTEMVTEQKCITIAGDTSQRSNLDTGFADWQEVLSHLSVTPIQVEPLRIAYRSTRQVMELARAVLGPLAAPDPPHAPRSGAPVEHHQLPTPGAAAAFIAEVLRPLAKHEPRASVAVLARYPEQADAYHQALQVGEVPNLRRVADYDFSFRPGVDVTDIRQVKGLEYDYVILVDVNASSYPASDEARYQLHIGATRAAHQLWLVSSGPPSPLIPAWLLERRKPPETLTPQAAKGESGAVA